MSCADSDDDDEVFFRVLVGNRKRRRVILSVSPEKAAEPNLKKQKMQKKCSFILYEAEVESDCSTSDGSDASSDDSLSSFLDDESFSSGNSVSYYHRQRSISQSDESF